MKNYGLIHFILLMFHTFRGWLILLDATWCGILFTVFIFRMQSEIQGHSRQSVNPIHTFSYNGSNETRPHLFIIRRNLYSFLRRFQTSVVLKLKTRSHLLFEIIFRLSSNGHLQISKNVFSRFKFYYNNDNLYIIEETFSHIVIFKKDLTIYKLINT